MHSLTHHFLIPTEHMNDERFFGSLIYICRHSADGAWGFVVNKPSKSLSVGGLLGDMRLDAGADAMKIPAMDGGVLRGEAGFILHTGLPEFQSSFAIGENVCLTTSRDILTRLAPVPQFSHYLLLMGFCSWKKDQLNAEINAGDWLTCPANAEILFHPDHEKKLEMAYELLGLNPEKLVPVIGQA